MRLSEKKRAALYKAVREPIIQKRITVKNSCCCLGEKNVSDIDDLLHQLEVNIWREVRKALNISER